MAVDLSQIQSLQTQISALTTQLNATPAGPAQDVIKAEIAGLNAQLTSAIQNAQAQNNAWTNMFSALTIFSGLNSGVGLSGITSLIKGLPKL